MIIPSIDLMGGRAVQLRSGKRPILSSIKDPVGLAKEFNRYGEVAVIDLDAALGTGDNLDLIRDMCRVADVRTGGGIRDFKRADDLLRAGAKKLIIGTSATPEFLKKLPADKIQVALDHKDGVVVDKGWTRSTGKDVLDRAEEVAPYCSAFLCTFVVDEGGMKGMNLDSIQELKKALPHPMTAAGGVKDTSEAISILKTEVDLQVGMALYTGSLDLTEVVINILDFDKYPLMPTVVQDENGQVLMLAYNTPESLRVALKNGSGTYFSRSRNEIWTKGLTSGNTQELISCRADCDSDTILFKVKQKGPACHTGAYSCFGQQQFTLEDLFNVLKERKANLPDSSYSARLFTDQKLLKEKILEEVNEVLNASDRRNLIWELADLTYFISVLAVREGIDFRDILAELGGRRR